MLERLRTIAPSIVFTVKREANPNFVWHGDGPDPKLNGYEPYDLIVTAQCIHDGKLLEKRDYHGGLYSMPGDTNYNDDDQLIQLIEGVSLDLHPVNEEIKLQLDKVLDFISSLPSSIYKSKDKFNFEQLIFFVECSLISVIDRIDINLPHSISWKERVSFSEPSDPCSLNSYEHAALETAGMTLAVFCSNLTDDGLGIYDALECTRIDNGQNFIEACERLIHGSWKDEGQEVKNRQDHLRNDTYPTKDLYGDLWPDTRKYAEAFVQKVFKDYLHHAALEYAENLKELMRDHFNQS